jgi:hypothetical protein
MDFVKVFKEPVFNIFHLRLQTKARFYKRKKGPPKFRAKEFSLDINFLILIQILEYKWSSPIYEWPTVLI